MITVSVLYEKKKGSTFNMSYYLNNHIPMLRILLGPLLRDVSVEEGVAGGSPDTPAPYAAIARLFFDSVESFQTAFGPHAKEIIADVANYTNIEPTIQINEIRVSSAVR